MTEEEKMEVEEEPEELTFEAPKAKSFGDVPESEKKNPKIGHAVEFRRKHDREPWEQKGARDASSYGDIPESEKKNPKIGHAVEFRKRHSKEPWEQAAVRVGDKLKWPAKMPGEFHPLPKFMKHAAESDDLTLLAGAIMMLAPLAIVMGLFAWPKQ